MRSVDGISMTSNASNDAAIGLLYSGGLDSGILLGHLLAAGRRVPPFYVRSHLHLEDAELKAARAFLDSFQSDALDPLIVLDMPLGDVYENHWSITGRETPDADSPDEAVYLPGRNALLAIKPALWCALHGLNELALAVLAANPFADATAEFFAEFSAMLRRAVGRPFQIVRPLAGLEKAEVMRLAENWPLEKTFSCIAPAGDLHCGQCNKCAERRRAFRDAGAVDPTPYATP